MAAFGGILVADGVTAQIVATTGQAKLTCFNADSGVRGSDLSVTEDSANDRLKLRVGVYKVDFFIDFTAPATLATYQFHARIGKSDGSVFLNELSSDIVSQHGVPLTTETQGKAEASGFLEVKQAMVDENGLAEISVYVEVSAASSCSITVVSGQLNVEKIF